MKWFFVLLIFLCFSIIAFADSIYYVSENASGANDGSDWNNAFNDLPENMERGAVYYIASGTYGPHLFNDTEYGTEMIVIRKATADVHGTNLGWASTLGEGTALFIAAEGPIFDFSKGYYHIDGQTGEGKSGHGIRIYNPFNGPGHSTGSTLRAASGTSAQHLLLEHIEVEGAGWGLTVPSATTRVCYFPGDVSYMTMRYCYIHEAGQQWVHISDSTNVLVEYCHFNHIGSNDPDLHSNGFQVYGESDPMNFVFRYNVLSNLTNDGATNYMQLGQWSGIPSGGYDVYGNIIYEDEPSTACSWVIGNTSNDVTTDVHIYNNTFYGLHGVGSRLYFTNSNNSNIAENNLWVNCERAPSFSNIIDRNNSKNTLTSDVFVDAGNGDFHLAVPAPGASELGNEYSTDPEGKTRGQDSEWDYGAYEYVADNSGGNIYYIDYENGDDNNDGLTKSTAWKRQPLMQNFGGTYTHSNGDIYIFKGGVIWPHECFSLIIKTGGTENNPDVYTVDKSWYSGSEWTRPIFDMEKEVLVENPRPVFITETDYVVFEGFEVKNQRIYGQNAWSWGGITVTNSSNITVRNCYVHDWYVSEPTITPDQEYGGVFISESPGSVLEDCVIHGGIETVTGRYSGTGIRNGYITRGCEVYDVPNGFLGGGIVEGNEIHHVYTSYDSGDNALTGDDGRHANGVYLFENAVFTNNYVHDIIAPGAPDVFPAAGWEGATGTMLICNNIIHGELHLNADGCVEGNNATWYVYNNLLYAGNSPLLASKKPSPGPLGNVYIKNNIFVVFDTYPNPVNLAHEVRNLVIDNNIYYIDNKTTNLVDGELCVLNVGNKRYNLEGSRTLGYNLNSIMSEDAIDLDYRPDSVSNIYVDTGADVSDFLDTDRDGVTRPQGYGYDIGIYEFEYQPLPDTEGPTTPQSLLATDIAANHLTLSWEASSDNSGVLGYEIYRDGQLIAQTNALTYYDSDVVPDWPYEYQILAYDKAKNKSGLSEVLNVRTLEGAIDDPPSKPINLTLSSVVGTSITILWEDTASTEDGFKLERKTGDIASFVKIADLPADTEIYMDEDLQQGVKYTYRICSYNVYGDSAYSNEEMAITPESGNDVLGSLLVYYKFDGNADDTMGNYNCQLYGPTLTPGKKDQAYLFNGDDYIDVDWGGELTGENRSFTISAWINTESMSTSNWILGDDTAYSHFLFGTVEGKLLIRWRTDDYNETVRLETVDTLPEGFCYVAATCDTEHDTLKLYINGQEAAVSTMTEIKGPTDFDHLNIGRGFQGSDAQYFNGIIDELRIYTRALSDEEILKVYNVVSEYVDVPEVEGLAAVVEYSTAYLSWKNPANQDEDWDNIVVKRIDNTSQSINEEELTPDDGVEVYRGQGNLYIDKDLDEGKYIYAIFACSNSDSNTIYSDPSTASVEIPATYNKKTVKIGAGEDGSLVIGQNTRGDLYTLWNDESISIGRGPTGNKTSLWLYSDIIGIGEIQVPDGSEIVSARLVFYVDNSRLYNQRISEETGEFNVINDDLRCIEIYQIKDPDNLGMPYYAEESGIRDGLDSCYRDHRPGVNKPWANPGDNENENTVNEKSEEISEGIEKLIVDQEPLDTIVFNPSVLSEDLLDTIEFDITDAVKAWADGEVNQGLYISTGQGRTGDGWNNGEMLKLFGSAAEETKEQQEYGQLLELEQEEYEQSVEPYMVIVYGSDSDDLTAPEPVENLSITQDEIQDSDIYNVTLNWTNPDGNLPANTDFAGVKIVRKENMIPFNHMDGDTATFLEDVNNTAVPEEFTDTDLVTGKTYYYALYTYDEFHNYSNSVWIKVTPGSPTAPSFDGDSSIITGKVSINWNTVTGAEGYRLYRENDSDELNQIVNSENGKTEGNSGYIYGNLSNYDDSTGNVKCIEINDGTANSYDDYLQLGAYTYWLTAFNDNGESSISSKITVEINDNNKAASIPATPTELKEVDLSKEEFSTNDDLLDNLDISNSIVKLTWTDNSNNESGFVIERMNDAGEWEEIYTTVYNVTEFIYSGLRPGTEYQYRIKAVNSAGKSGYAECQARTDGIADISWEVISASHVKVTWKAIENASYKVELQDMEDNVLEEQDLSTDYCYFVTLLPDTGYRVRITAYIAGEEKYTTESDIIRTSMDAKGGLF